MQKFIALISLALSSVAAPAQAQSLGTLLDAFSKGTSMVNGTNHCKYYSGAEQLSCNLNRTKTQIDRVSRMGENVKKEREIAQTTRAQRSGEISNPNPRAMTIATCAFGNQTSCLSAGIGQAEAVRIMNRMAAN